MPSLVHSVLISWLWLLSIGLSISVPPCYLHINESILSTTVTLNRCSKYAWVTACSQFLRLVSWEHQQEAHTLLTRSKNYTRDPTLSKGYLLKCSLSWQTNYTLYHHKQRAMGVWSQGGEPVSSYICFIKCFLWAVRRSPMWGWLMGDFSSSSSATGMLLCML